MVEVKCPVCSHQWNFTGKPRGLKHTIRCPNVNCGRIWFPMPELEYQQFENEKTPKKLTIDVWGKGITNHGRESYNPSSCEIEIILKITNNTSEGIGIRDISVESLDKDVLIPVYLEDMEETIEGKLKRIYSLYLEPKYTRQIRIFVPTRPPVSMDKKFVPTIINFYDTNKKILEKIPHKLYIGWEG